MKRQIAQFCFLVMPGMCLGQSYIFGPGVAVRVDGYSTQTSGTGSPTTYNFTLNDFVPAPPPPPGSQVCLIRQGDLWVPQTVTTSGSYGNPGGTVQDSVTITVSSDGTFTETRRRSGPVFTWLASYTGTLNDTFVVNLNAGTARQTTTGAASENGGSGQYTQQFTLYSQHELELDTTSSCSSGSSLHRPPALPGLTSLSDLLALPPASALSTDGVSRILLIVPVPDSLSPVTFAISSGVTSDSTAPPVLIGLSGDMGGDSIDVLPQLNGVQSYAAIYVQAPDSVPDLNLENNSITVSATQNGTVVNQSTVQLFCPPVVALHGVWSNGDAWKGLKAFLEDVNPYPYLTQHIELVDYGDRSSYSYTDRVTQGRLLNSIQSALRQYADDGIVATSVDVVAHSMGGLVTRYFLTQALSNVTLIHRFITVGTPALGSPLADKLIEYKDKQPIAGSFWWYSSAPPRPTLGELFADVLGKNVTNGGVKSLETTEIDGGPLSGGYSIIPPLAIHGIAPAGSVMEKVLDTFLSSFGTAHPAETVLGLLGDGHDTIVPGYSQVAGAKLTTEISGIVHAGVGDVLATETNDTRVFQQIYDWLRAGTLEIPRYPLKRSSTSEGAAATPLVSPVDLSGLTLANFNLLKTNPPDLSTIPAGTRSVITFSSAKPIVEVICLGAAALGVTDLTKAPFECPVVPPDFSAIQITVVAVFGDGTYTTGKLNYKAGPPASIWAIQPSSTHVNMANVGDSWAVHVRGNYGSTTVDVTSQATYALASNTTTVASVTKDGVVRATGRGADLLNIAYAGGTLNVPLVMGDCSYELAGGSTVPAAGEIHALLIATQPDCHWTVTSDSTWLKPVNSPNGMGSQTISFAVSANSSSVSRLAVLRVGGKTKSLLQGAAGCAYSVTGVPAQLGANQTSFDLNIATRSDCGWNLSSQSTWLSPVTAGILTGTRKVTIQVAENGGSARLSTLLVAGREIVIQQAAGTN